LLHGMLQNMTFLSSGTAFGGDSSIPHLNLPETGREPESLDGIMSSDPVVATINNHSGVVPLQPRAVTGLARALRQTQPLQSGDLSDFIRGRLTANSAGPGRVAAAAALMRAGFDRAPKVHHQLAQLVPPVGQRSPEQQTVALIAQCFRLSIARSAIYAPTEFFDVHASEQAKTQPKL